MNIRAAQPGDLPQIVLLERAATGAAHWPGPEYADVLNIAAGGGPEAQSLVRRIFVAEAEAQADTEAGLLGFVAVKCVLLAEPIPAEIENLAVAEHARRHGIARALMVAAINWAREHGAVRMQLEVRAGNAAAIALYRSLEFTAMGRRPGYYSQPREDALLLDRTVQ